MKKKSKEIFIFDYPNKRIYTIRFGLINYENYLKIIRKEMKKHLIRAEIKKRGKLIALFRTI